MTNLSKKFWEEYERSVDIPDLDYSVEPLIDEEYKEACFALVSSSGTDFLSDALLAKKLKSFESDIASLKVDYPADYKYCLVVMPCTEMGSDLPPEAIELGRYLFLLRIQDDGATVNFAGHNSRYYDLLPEYIRKNCTFEIEWKDDGENFPDGENFNAFKEKYTKAFEVLRKYFS